jgi:hypothetical protein
MRSAFILIALFAVPGCNDDEGAPTSAPACVVDPAAPKKKIAEVGCCDGAQCESGFCFAGNAQSFCTVRCTAENAVTVCVAPLTGSCNQRGFCKRD